jgi:hypothetical protein
MPRADREVREEREALRVSIVNKAQQRRRWVAAGGLMILLWFGLIVRGGRAVAVTTADTASVDFKQEIEPIFAAACYGCHGPTKAAGQLRLDRREAALKGGIGGPVILPTRAAESRLLHRILGAGGEARMPLGGGPLTAEQTDRIRRWIEEGANWPDSSPTAEGATTDELPIHWAYRSLSRPIVPRVERSGWVRNPIDPFILARLEQEGLTPSPEASRETLLRRVSLDLIGLPPTLEEIDAFLADNSPDAYEKVVDRLLSSPHYGERWARPWLDLARYADSHGYESDGLRTMWRYRDWVIDALNRDLPFDRFTIEQLAGDLLPNPTTEQLIATGFHRNTLLNREGGTDGDEQRYQVLVDRVNTTATVWLGSTLGCAQCHHHKYDPFTIQDYYRMYAFFETTEHRIGDKPNQRFLFEPELELPTPAQELRRKEIRRELKGLEEVLGTMTPRLLRAQAQWEKDRMDDSREWVVVPPVDASSTGGTTLTLLPDHSVLASGDQPEIDEYHLRATLRPAGGKSKGITAFRIEALPHPSLPREGPGRDLYGHFLLSTIEATVDGRPLSFADGGWDNGQGSFDAESFFGFQPGQVSDRPRGWTINATQEEVRLPRQAVFVLREPLRIDRPTEVVLQLKFLGGSLPQGLGRVRWSVTESSAPLRIVEVSAAMKRVLAKPVADRSEKEKQELAAQFRELTPRLRRERERRKQLDDSLNRLGIVTALILREQSGASPAATWVRERGNFASLGEKVEAGTPEALHPWPTGAPTNRLGLARWLVDDRNPLVARVGVNRMWEQFFGQGIVETSEDFGFQASPATHPELLDWLAIEWRERGWRTKPLHRLIVTSATYRQVAAVSPELLTRDPANRLLGRGPRFRVEAEMIRDLALTASGLLSRKIGGPSVMPPQPEGIWRTPYNREKWRTATGEDRYRRGLYTFLRRTSPYPAMIAFDATSRENCTVRRVRTNTPLQSLTLLNDEAMLEMARALAKRILTHVKGSTREQLVHAFRLCLTRRPTEAELDRLMAFYLEQQVYYRAHPEMAARLLPGESTPAAASALAAWTLVANVLLNLDEALTKQ